MTADIIPLPGVTVTSPDGQPYEAHACVVEEIESILELAKSGELRSFVLVGETYTGAPIQSLILCEADLHVMNSALSLAQDRVKGMLMDGAHKYEAPTLES
jgi:hypothetical protein